MACGHCRARRGRRATPAESSDFLTDHVRHFGSGATYRNHTIHEHLWNIGTDSRDEYRLIYFVHTQDGEGGRVNLAMVVNGGADEVEVVENPVERGRVALGLRYGTHWYFTVHNLARGRGGDSAVLLDAIDDFVSARGAHHRWTVGGDFNVEPQVLLGRDYFPPLAGIIATDVNTPTHNSGNRLDYFVTTEPPLNPDQAYVLGGPPSDHRPVGAGRMHAAAQPPSGLRVMALGDSISEGHGSSNSSGYRAHMQEDLGKISVGQLLGTASSTLAFVTLDKRDLVGSRSHGDVPDPHHEGWPGFTIDGISGKAATAVRALRPNVVTLLAGTNDMVGDVDVAGAPARLSALIDLVLAGSPGVAVVVGTLPPAQDPTVQSRITAYNAAVRTMLDARVRRGDHLVRVELAELTPADLADGLHPNDQGYRKIADAFTAGIHSALLRGWVGEPAPQSPTGGPVRGWAPQGVVASGTMAPGAQPGALALGSGDRVHFADLDGDRRDDYLVTRADQSVEQWTNGGVADDGTVTWHSYRRVSTPRWDVPVEWRFADFDVDGRAEMVKYDPARGDLATYKSDGTVASYLPSRGIAGRYVFGDLDDPGRADWLTVADDSSVTARLSLGRGAVGPVLAIAPGVGVPGDRVRFADMDANGIVDYLVVNPDSSVRAWLNDGFLPSGTGAMSWREEGTVATGVGVAGDRIHFGDLDGDGRADYLDVDPTTGTTRMWRSTGVWQWEPRGSVTTGSPARVVYADLDANGTADYLQVNANGSVQAWLNGGRTGSGEEWIWRPQGTIASGVGAPGSRVRFTDLDGNGLADYLVVGADSSVRAWLNGGRNWSGGEEWIWRPQGTIARGVGARGDEVRFADADGNGLADYWRVNDDSSVQAWLSGGLNPSGGEEWIWRPQGTVAGGVVAPGSHVRIADLTGDRRPDYLVLHDDSSVDMWTNGGPRPEGGEWLWQPQGQVASGVGVPGSRVQLADLDGDGRADYLDVDPRTGSTRAWVNVP